MHSSQIAAATLKPILDTIGKGTADIEVFFTVIIGMYVPCLGTEKLSNCTSGGATGTRTPATDPRGVNERMFKLISWGEFGPPMSIVLGAYSSLPGFSLIV